MDDLDCRLRAINAYHEKNWILQHVLRQPKSLQSAVLEDVLRRRERGEPLAYIEGAWSFRDLHLKVGPGVLIPRPETEELVDYIFSKVDWLEKQEWHVVDMGAGTGCLGLGLADELNKKYPRKEMNLHFFEKSNEALKYLYQNIETYATKWPNIKLMVHPTSWLECDFKFDVLCSNPPYISSKEWLKLDTSVREYEPKMALVPERANDFSAMGCYKELLQIARHHLRQGGWVGFEIGFEQEPFIENYANSLAIFSKTELVRDMAGKLRFFGGKRG